MYPYHLLKPTPEAERRRREAAKKAHLDGPPCACRAPKKKPVDVNNMAGYQHFRDLFKS